MDLYEYQAKELFRAHGVPAPDGTVVTTVDDAVAAAEALGLPVMVKSQVKIGGRGKAGGVKFAATIDDVRTHAGNILGLDIKGHITRQVLITPAQRHRRGVLRLLPARPVQPHLPGDGHPRGRHGDRAARRGAARRAGARSRSTRCTGVDAAKAAEIADAGKFPAEVRDQVIDVLQHLWETFVAEDATLVEVNPLVKDDDGTVVALDGKVSLDENASLPAPGPRRAGRQRRGEPARGAGQGEAPQLRQARRRGRHHRQRRRTGDVHAGRRRLRGRGARRRQAGELPGHRRRRQRRGDGQRPGHHPDRPGRQGGVRQRVRRHHRLRRGGQRHRPGARRSSGTRPTSRSSSGWTATTSRRVGASSPRRRIRWSPRPTPWTTAPTRPPNCAQRGSLKQMAIFLDENSRVIVQGMTGSEGMKHTARMLASGTNIVGGVNARKAGTTASFDGGRRSRCSAPSSRRSRRPGRTSRCCSCRRRSPRTRSSRRSTPASSWPW